MLNTHEAIHEFSGFLPQVFGIPVYFLIVSLAFSASLVWWVKRVEARGLTRNLALDVALVVMFAGLFGARLLHVLIEEPHYYLESPWRVFEVWNGGFVWYGGAIAGAGAGILWVWRKKHGIPIWLDMAAPVAALGYAIGRLACLFTGCCFGDVCTLASGLKFRYPTQAFAVVWETAVVLALLALERRSRLGTGAVWLRTHGRLFALWIALHAVGRLLMELMRADPRGPTPLGLSLSTWISFALVFGAAVAFRSTGRAGR